VAAHGVAPLPRAAYVHVPFCKRRCGYCNFTLVAGRDDLVGAYLTAIDLELAALSGPHEVDTLFLGGGTPTHLATKDFARLLAIARRHFVLAGGAEFSIEANPLDLNPEKVACLAAAGVTRISLGAQSFDASKLAVLERDHAPDDVVRAVDQARGAVRSVSVDLIFGVPGETLEIWQRDLDMAVAAQTDHVSTYGLTFEKGAAFWSRREKSELSSLGEELERDLYVAAIDRLAAAGFAHYEVSNFARPGHRCRHNETYWRGDGYFGVGPGAASYVDGRRAMNHRSTTAYIKRVMSWQSAVAEVETLPAEDRARELLVFALRRIEGVDRAWFAARTGYTVDALAGGELQSLIEHGILEDDILEDGGTRVRLTREGLLVSDSIWPRLL